MFNGQKKYDNKTDYIKEFGKKLDWNVEVDEFSNFKEAGGYQTADEADEDAYPEPGNRVKLTVENSTNSLEETYYWFLHWLRTERGYTQIEKIYDVFSASENSAVFGNMAQRHSIQQDRASQFLRGIGQLIKELFQLVREIRVIDQKLEPYYQWKEKKSADITLKHQYITLVEGTSNNPDSVYALAGKIGFTVLPDLFFGTHVYDLDKIDNAVDKEQTGDFNNVVKTVLKRKLFEYINWKQKTEKELESRRRFQLRYLRQHWSVIQMYMSWIRPYLRTIQRMERKQSMTESADLISMFDNTLIEIEILAKKPLNMREQVKNKDNHYNCILMTFKYSTQPTLSYKPEYGQQAVAHTGKVDVTLRGYGWHKEDIDTYKKMRHEEDLEMMHYLNEHVGGAMDFLGEEFQRYLEEAEEEGAMAKKRQREKKKEQEAEDAKELDKKKRPFKQFGMLEPFIEMGSGITELFGSMIGNPTPAKAKNNDATPVRDKKKLQKAQGTAAFEAYLAFMIYKKSHQMLAW